MCELRYAKLERGLGEVDRARAIYVHASAMADPRRDTAFWADWNAFEVQPSCCLCCPVQCSAVLLFCRAVLCCAALRCAVLCCDVLCFAALFRAVLCCAVLCCAAAAHVWQQLMHPLDAMGRLLSTKWMRESCAASAQHRLCLCVCAWYANCSIVGVGLGVCMCLGLGMHVMTVAA